MNIQPKMIILRGNSGCGKTTIAKRLQRSFGRGTLLISQDAVRREMLFEKDGPETKAIDLLIRLVKYGKEHCETVILEGILYADWYQKLFDVVKDEFESNIFAYYFDVSFEETLIRHKTKPNANEFGEIEMKRWWKEHDYLPLIGECLISQDMTEEFIVGMIIEQTRTSI